MQSNAHAATQLPLTPLQTRQIKATWENYPLNVKHYVVSITDEHAVEKKYHVSENKLTLNLVPGRYTATLSAVLTDGRTTASTELQEFSLVQKEIKRDVYRDFTGNGRSSILVVKDGQFTVLSDPKDGAIYRLSMPAGTKFLSGFRSNSNQIIGVVETERKLNWRLFSIDENQSLEIGTFGVVGYTPIGDCKNKGQGVLVISRKKGVNTEVQVALGTTIKTITIKEKIAQLFCSYEQTSHLIAIKKEKNSIQFIKYDLNGKVLGRTPFISATGVPFVLPTSQSHTKLVVGLVSKKGDVFTARFNSRKIVTTKGILPNQLPQVISVGEDGTSLHLITQYKDSTSHLAVFDGSDLLINSSEKIILPQGKLVGSMYGS